MPDMDYTELIVLIKKNGFTQKSVAKAVNLTESHFSRKLSGEYPFTQIEIQKLCEMLKIRGEDIAKYFFTPKVE